ncbi:Nn.00g017860.m01.CDS01 [Neocucurbitaria sp. VM-36]
MEHYAPHYSANFEGFYSKFDLASGAHIALIICSVPNASSRPHMVSFTYYPASGAPIFQREHFVDTIERVTTNQQTKAFELRIPGIGTMRAAGDGTTAYELHAQDGSWTLQAQSASQTAWRNDKSTPEGWMINLPLPLHWHVHSLCSPCTFTLCIPSLSADALTPADRTGNATLHQEKNWANSFPDAHMWVQAWDAAENRGICLAGGKILYNTAYMLGYRSPNLNLDFVPPFAVSYLNVLSPFMSVRNDWESRTFSIAVSNYFYKLELKAHAPRDSGWFGLASPFPDGHRANYCIESFLATVEVDVFERKGWLPWSGWSKVKTERFEGASLEFAGGYYPERGERKEE